MIKIINGMRYSMKKSKLIGSYSNSYNENDFHYYSEDLYLTKKGNYFLYKYGGALSCMAKSCGNNATCDDSDIIPIGKDEAKDWLENNNKIEALEKYFEKELIDA